MVCDEGAFNGMCWIYPSMTARRWSSKLTTKAQTTIPQPVRVALRLKPGDEPVVSAGQLEEKHRRASAPFNVSDCRECHIEWTASLRDRARRGRGGQCAM